MDTLPHDLKSWPSHYLSWLFYFGLIFLFLALVLVFVLIYGKKKNQKQKNIYLETLKKLHPEIYEGSWGPSYYFSLSEIFRFFLSQGTKIQGNFLTLKELELELETLKAGPWTCYLEEWLQFCRRAEEIKFAEIEPSYEENKLWYEKIHAWSEILMKDENKDKDKL